MNLQTDNYLMLSGIQHFVFCKRQCALIHLERVWNENALTLIGKDFHERVDEVKSENKKTIKIEKSFSLRSDKFKIIGIADIVEFHLKGMKWHPYPVEYKVGKPKAENHDEVQLCAQALCLEEMLDLNIREGAIFYGKTREKIKVEINLELRNLTIEAIEGFHELMNSKKLPRANYNKKCEKCSLKEVCMPELETINLKNYLLELEQ